MGQFDRKKQSQPKHGKPSDSGASKAPPPLTRGVPGWKAPGYVQKKKSAPTPPKAVDTSKQLEHALPVDLEQRMLEVFRTTFPASNDFEGLKPTLQEVKDALLRRDFDAAFGKHEHLEAYAIRWSSSRALSYAQLLAWICEERKDDAPLQQLVGSASHRTAAKVVCFGGGAAEMMAFAGLLRYSQPSEAAGKPGVAAADLSDSLEAVSISAPDSRTAPLLHLNHLDMADWASVFMSLERGLNTPPALSKYASTTARGTNASFLLPGALKHAFINADVLKCGIEDLRVAIGSDPAFLTLMFTLNELYMTSMPRTTAFLCRMTEAAPKGSLLLVADIPGAYSETEGEDKRQYPMSRLLDYALLPRPGQEDSDDEQPERAWEKVIEEANMSYKLSQGLRYPVSLENQRLQVHLFKRV